MLRYQSRRHRYLMDESEQALENAVEGTRPRDARIAKHVLGDAKIHSLWESRHADLIVPVAENSRRDNQIFKLREIELTLLHRRALIRCIRERRIVGAEREKLFSVFYGPKDTQNAIRLEHRQYTLAVSSRVSTDHLIDVMHDPVSVNLLAQYEAVYTKYFELYCFSVSCEDETMGAATRTEMSTLRRRAMQMIKRIHSERPDRGGSTFEREALLARSGRYPVQNYLLG